MCWKTALGEETNEQRRIEVALRKRIAELEAQSDEYERQIKELEKEKSKADEKISDQLAKAQQKAENLIVQAELESKEIVKEARRYDKLEGSERVVSNKVLLKKVQLDLKKFGNGSPDFYVRRADMIAFVCAKSAPGFKGGIVTAMITKHEEAEGSSHFYTLDNCTAATN